MKEAINWKAVWQSFDQWAYNGKGKYNDDALSATGRKVISQAVNKQLKGAMLDESLTKKEMF